MARLNQTKVSTGKRILLIDDQNEYLISTVSLLEREGHIVIGALNGEEGLKLLKNDYFDLLLVDYYMPGGMTGEDVVNALRKFNPYIQIILQTGYAGEYPPREMLKRLDIQGYHDKTDGPDRLLMWVDVGLKAAYTVQLLFKSKLGLKYILDITPELHKIQQLQELFQGILYQISGLIGIFNTFLATIPDKNITEKKEKEKPDGFVATLDENEMSIRAATGKFFGFHNVSECLKNDKTKEIQDVFNNKKIYINDNKTIVPLFIAEDPVGLIYLDAPIKAPQDIELLQVFASQAALAIQNSMLYEMATLDTLTNVFVRRFFDQLLIRELQSSFRAQQNFTLMMMDMDNLKQINDTIGHLAGDKTLTILGKVLLQATRSTDYVSRYGGDEFSIILPRTSVDQAKFVSDRIFKLLSEHLIEGPSGKIPISISIGACCIKPHAYKNEEMPKPILRSYYETMAKLVVSKSDEMMYVAKKERNNKIVFFENELEWPAF